MAETINVLRKVAAKIEVTPGTYLAPDVLLPFTSFTEKQQFDMIEDASIVGVAFMDLPAQGVRRVSGSLEGQVEKDAIVPILEAGWGAVAAKVFTTPEDKNVKSLSFAALDGVKNNRYAGSYLKTIEFTSAAEGDLKYSAEIIAFKAEDRQAVGDFPAISTSPSTVRFLHHHAGGASGYMRIGDQANALAAGDDMGIEEVTFGLQWNFNEQFDNTSQGALIPLSGGDGRPTASLTFKISRHDADTFHTFRDNFTALQADFKYFQSATGIFQAEIPNFVVTDVVTSEDDINRLDVTCMVARNGTGSTFSNTNMAFISPIRVSLTNT